MTVRRLVVFLLVVVAICIVNIYHHALTVKYGYELGRLQAERARMRISIASLEGSVTMLASPSRLKAANERMQIGLVGPSKWQDAAAPTAFASIDGPAEGLVQR